MWCACGAVGGGRRGGGAHKAGRRGAGGKTEPRTPAALPTLICVNNFTPDCPRSNTQVAKYIEQMAGDLELAAHPALDALTSTVRYGLH